MTSFRVMAWTAAAASLLAICGTKDAKTATPPPAQPGDLTKPLAQYTGDELYALVNGLQFGNGHDRQRNCRGPQCAGGQKVNVTIDAVLQEDSLSTGDISQFGVIAARAVNHGNAPEAKYGMLGGPRAYYLVVLPDTSWVLEEMDTNAGHAHRTLTTGRFRGCGHPFVPGARADFKTCAQPSAGASATTHSPFSFASFPQDPDPPIWIGCASGCCTADNS